MSNTTRRDFLKLGALAGSATALGLEAQSVHTPLTKETWVLNIIPDMIDDYVEQHPMSGFFRRTREFAAQAASEYLQEHPPVHEFWRLGDTCLQGFSADRFTGKRLEFEQAQTGLIQCFAMTNAESDLDRKNHHHQFLKSRDVHLGGPAARLDETELLGVMMDVGVAINRLNQPYKALTTNSNKVFVTIGDRLGLCPEDNCRTEVTEIAPYALFGGNIPFPVTPVARFQSLAQQGKSADDMRKIFNTERMAGFANASIDLDLIGPRKSQNRMAACAT